VVTEESGKDHEAKGEVAGGSATTAELKQHGNKKPLLLYKNSHGFRTIDKEKLVELIELINIDLKHADAGKLDDFYIGLYNTFIPVVGTIPLEYTVPAWTTRSQF
jgi:hypothetical protein